MAEDSAEGAVVNARIVFWGIEGSGKTANLQAIFAKLRPDHRGEMREVATPFDPTVSYEELPIELGEIAGGGGGGKEHLAQLGTKDLESEERVFEALPGIIKRLK